MIPWLSFERRWRDELCAAALPGYEASDSEAFWRRFSQTAAPMLRNGFRVAVWLFTLAPPVLIRRPRTFGHLTAPERDACLVHAAEHRARLVRDLAGTLRLAASMAHFADPAVRARAGAGDST